MMPRKGDIYECPACRLSFTITHSCEYSEFESDQMRCCCGAIPALKQSGSESVSGEDVQEIRNEELQEQEHEQHHAAFS